jgi:hypothetical protein
VFGLAAGVCAVGLVGFAVMARKAPGKVTHRDGPVARPRSGVTEAVVT